MGSMRMRRGLLVVIVCGATGVPADAAVFRACGSMRFPDTDSPRLVVRDIRTRNTPCAEARGFVRRWQALPAVPSRLRGWTLSQQDANPVTYRKGPQRIRFSAVAYD